MKTRESEKAQWTLAPRGWRESTNAEKLASMQAGEPTWGNPCEVRRCPHKAAATVWVEVDGTIYEVCPTHAAEVSRG